MSFKRLLTAGMVTGLILASTLGWAQERIRFSCSAQLVESFGTDRLKAFTKETGIEVDLYVCSSNSAVYRLINGFSDIAGSAAPLYSRYTEKGFMEIPFCKDPLVVIVNACCGVDNLSGKQLQDIFNKTITNWKEIGGEDQPIIVVIPGKGTAAFKNFQLSAMDGKEIIHDYASYLSSQVIEAVKSFPYAISFIARSTVYDKTGIKTLKVNGLLPEAPEYPYVQTFYYITRGTPTGAVKKFIDFTLSPNGKAFMKSKGMRPISP